MEFVHRSWQEPVSVTLQVEVFIPIPHQNENAKQTAVSVSSLHILLTGLPKFGVSRFAEIRLKIRNWYIKQSGLNAMV